MMFAACEKQHCVNVNIVDDMVNEPEEMFHYTLKRTPGLDPAMTIGHDNGEIVILDDDGISLMYTHYCDRSIILQALLTCHYVYITL